MGFQDLGLQLLARVRELVRNGSITERRLARLSGISQPHIHNVLKGARTLSAESADRLMQCLQIELKDLIGGGGSSR